METHKIGPKLNVQHLKLNSLHYNVRYLKSKKCPTQDHRSILDRLKLLPLRIGHMLAA